MKRRLTLKAEHLAELTTVEMAAVAGAYQIPPTQKCFTGMYPSINMPCPTLEAVCDSVQNCIVIDQTPLCPTTV